MADPPIAEKIFVFVIIQVVLSMALASFMLLILD
jgi:hypothetical protein